MFDFAFAASFDQIDILSMIAAATTNKLTGFLRLTWQMSAEFDSLIAHDLLDAGARAGEGKIFFVGGEIIDATLDQPEVAADATPHKVSVVLSCLMQLGLGIGFSVLPVGTTVAYIDQNISARKPRLSVPNSASFLIHLITVREKEVSAINPQLHVGARATGTSEALNLSPQ